MRGFLGRRQGRVVLAVLLLAGMAACGNGDDEASSTEKFARFGFLARVTSGPDAGKSWTGDLLLTPTRPAPSRAC